MSTTAYEATTGQRFTGRTTRPYPVKTGRLFKINEKGFLILARNLGEARFICTKDRTDSSCEIDVSRWR